ncbi:GTPase Era [bacterium]|nr:GTPase Era [bacterium]
MKSGFVTIIGRPNVGKSTLLNAILGQKIVIATDKAQTTRKRIKGIFTDERGQIVFIDTPGVHKPLNDFGECLVDEAKIALPDSDLILFLVDGSEPAGKGDKWISDNLLSVKTPIFIVMNKTDKLNSEQKLNENLETYKKLFDKDLEVIKISALNNNNVDELINTLFSNLPEGVKFFDDDTVTDENMRFITTEIIREKILTNTQDEIPHSVFVKIEKYEEHENIDKIYAVICCEQKSQKGILIGKNGSLLKKIGMEARIELEEILEKKVYLELYVKIEKNWRKNKKILKDIGYEQFNN